MVAAVWPARRHRFAPDPEAFVASYRTMVGMPMTRAYSAAHFALELDQKKDVGLFKSIEGGGAKEDLIKYQNGGEAMTFMRQGRLKFEDFKVQVGMAMSEVFYTWISQFFAGIPDRRTGAVVAADFYFNERARREFDQAMITEVTFPKLDGTDKGACYLNVTISPETVSYKAGSGQKIEQAGGFQAQKLWAACNFDLTINTLEDACKRVTKIDSFTIKQKPIEYNEGGRRSAVKVPGRIEYPNLVFYVPEADAQPFIDNHIKYTMGGEVHPDERLHGEINTYDNSNGKLFTVDFAGGLIFNITHDKADAASEDIKQVKIEMSTETMSFTYLPYELE
jgi:hypothetical protein